MRPLSSPSPTGPSGRRSTRAAGTAVRSSALGAATLLLLATVGWGGPGCMQEYPVESGAGAQSVSNCLEPEDCPTGQMCEFGLCTVADAPAELVSLRITPPEGSGVLPQQRLDIPVGLDRRLPDVVLANTVTLSGTVRMEAEVDGPSIAARISATARGTLPGITLRRQTAAAHGSGFSLTLVAGSVYDLTVDPEGEALPVLREAGLGVDADGEWHVRLPRADTYRRLRGRVVAPSEEDDAPAGKGGTPGPLGVAGIQARAVGVEHGLLSTTSVTDSDGAFEVLLPPDGDESYRLHLTPTEESPHYPRVTVEDIDPGAAPDLGDITVGGGGAAVTVAGALVNDDGVAAGPGATIEFRAPVGAGIYETTARADPEGRFKVDLLTGDYDVRIVPAMDGPDAVTRWSCSVRPESPSFGPFVVQSKTELAGRILDPSGEAPVAGVVVEALLVGNGDVEGLYRAIGTLSEPDGSFRLALDPGSHDLTLIPPPHLGMPRRLEHSLSLHGATQQEFQLRDPSVIHGTLLLPGGAPLAGIKVSVYTVDEGRADLIGEGETAEDGSYRIVLPSGP